MSANLTIYGESAGSAPEVVVTGATYTVLAGQQVKITKLQGTMELAGYIYFRTGVTHVFAFWFWGTGQQSEDNLMFRYPAGTVVNMAVTQAVAANTRCSATGIIELLPQP